MKLPCSKMNWDIGGRGGWIGRATRGQMWEYVRLICLSAAGWSFSWSWIGFIRLVCLIEYRNVNADRMEERDEILYDEVSVSTLVCGLRQNQLTSQALTVPSHCATLSLFRFIQRQQWWRVDASAGCWWHGAFEADCGLAESSACRWRKPLENSSEHKSKASIHHHTIRWLDEIEVTEQQVEEEYWWCDRQGLTRRHTAKLPCICCLISICRSIDAGWHLSMMLSGVLFFCVLIPLLLVVEYSSHTLCMRRSQLDVLSVEAERTHWAMTRYQMPEKSRTQHCALGQFTTKQLWPHSADWDVADRVSYKRTISSLLPVSNVEPSQINK
jgi:hypothetical protein